MNYSNECQTCFGQIQGQIYKCTCQIALCNTCMFEWAKSQLSDQLQKDKPTFTCPQINNSEQSVCKKKSITSILKLMKKAINENTKKSKIDTHEKKIIKE